MRNKHHIHIWMKLKKPAQISFCSSFFHDFDLLAVVVADENCPGTQLSRGPIVHIFKADNWAPDNWAPGPNCPGPNLPLFQGGQLVFAMMFLMISESFF